MVSANQRLGLYNKNEVIDQALLWCIYKDRGTIKSSSMWNAAASRYHINGYSPTIIINLHALLRRTEENEHSKLENVTKILGASYRGQTLKKSAFRSFYLGYSTFIDSFNKTSPSIFPFPTDTTVSLKKKNTVLIRFLTQLVSLLSVSQKDIQWILHWVLHDFIVLKP